MYNEYSDVFSLDVYNYGEAQQLVSDSCFFNSMIMLFFQGLSYTSSELDSLPSCVSCTITSVVLVFALTSPVTNEDVDW